jgi:hypothetical protein
MDAADLLTAAAAFAQRLATLKSELSLGEHGWYPYGSMDNFVHLDNMLTGEHRDVLRYAASRPILDVGAADGDTAFFLESLGYDVHVIEYPPTNFNGCRGIHALRDELDSNVEITELDLDSQFRLPEGRFGLTFLLGLLYHLKNPFYVLESLAGRSEHMLLSTRVAQYNVVEGGEDAQNGVNLARVDISSIPAAYLVDPHEANDDPTNYWMFTQAGLRRILSRTGWELLDFITVGVTDGSDPATMDHDERAVCFLRSRVVEG